MLYHSHRTWARNCSFSFIVLSYSFFTTAGEYLCATSGSNAHVHPCWYFWVSQFSCLSISQCSDVSMLEYSNVSCIYRTFIFISFRIRFQIYKIYQGLERQAKMKKRKFYALWLCTNYFGNVETFHVLSFDYNEQREHRRRRRRWMLKASNARLQRQKEMWKYDSLLQWQNSFILLA